MNEGSESSKSCTKGASMLRERRREAGPGCNGSVRETGLGRDNSVRESALPAACEASGMWRSWAWRGRETGAGGGATGRTAMLVRTSARASDSRRCCLAFDAAFRWGSLPDCLIASKAGAAHRAWRWPAGTSPNNCLRGVFANGKIRSTN